MTFSDINTLAKQRKPFLFISDFKAENLKVVLLKNLLEEDVEFQIEKKSSLNNSIKPLKKYPQSFEKYKKKFDYVLEKIKSGETYLLNLTQETKMNDTEKVIRN